MNSILCDLFEIMNRKSELAYSFTDVNRNFQRTGTVKSDLVFVIEIQWSRISLSYKLVKANQPHSQNLVFIFYLY
jgi:hypothetical protein